MWQVRGTDCRVAEWSGVWFRLEKCASPAVAVGGDEGTRTLNPCLAKAVLCQLSYVPEIDKAYD